MCGITGFIDGSAVRGSDMEQHLLWDILMLKAWRTRWETPAVNAA